MNPRCLKCSERNPTPKLGYCKKLNVHFESSDHMSALEGAEGKFGANGKITYPSVCGIEQVRKL